MTSADRVHVVVGGGSGLGFAAAQALGGRLLLADVDAERLATAVGALTREGAVVDGLVCDVADRASVLALAERARATGRLGAVVNTAGVCPPAVTDSARVVDVNLLGTINVLDAFEPLVAEDSVGICLASVGGHRRFTHAFDDVLRAPERTLLLEAIEARIGLADNALYVYGITKRGVILQCAGRAGRWGARGGRLVSVSPGHIGDTTMGESVPHSPYTAIAALRRAGRAAEVAEAIRYLASDAASYVTGCDLRVDGGTVAGIEHGGSAADAEAWHHPPQLAG